MGFFKRLSGKESLDERMNRLWETAKKLCLGGSDAELQKALSMYTELLGLVDENSTLYNICAILGNRAITYRRLKQYDAALEDLLRELEISQRRGDHFGVMHSQKLIEETRECKRKAEIEASGGEKATKFQTMEQQAHKLWSTGPDADEAFESFFADLENDDADVRAQASRLLADSSNAVRKLISIYQECVNADPHRASLAGRALGRKIAKGSDNMISAQIAQVFYGVAVSFIPCPCAHCGHLNLGIPAPPRGPMVPYYTQKDSEGAYAVPVLCDRCGKEFFVVWDVNPT